MANPHRIIGDENSWVEFKAQGYPFRLRKDLHEASDDEAVLKLVIPYIVACNISKIDGGTLTKIESIDDLYSIDEKLALNIIWSFYDFRAERQREPLPKGT